MQTQFTFLPEPFELEPEFADEYDAAELEAEEGYAAEPEFGEFESNEEFRARGRSPSRRAGSPSGRSRRPGSQFRPTRPPFRPPSRPRPPRRPGDVGSGRPGPWPRPRPPSRGGRIIVRPGWSEPAPTPAHPEEPAAWKQGAESEFVRWVQHSLNLIQGSTLTVDGVMSAETRAAIRDFQQRTGLLVDGIVGPETQRALEAERQKLGEAEGEGELDWLPYE